MKNTDVKRILKKVNQITTLLDDEDFIHLEKDEKGHLREGLSFEKDENNIDVEKSIDILLSYVRDVTY